MRPQRFPFGPFRTTARSNRLYTQITFCFSSISAQSDLQAQAIDALKQGVERPSANFPWVAGKVVKEYGICKIQAQEEPLSFLVKNLRHDSFMPNWDTLWRARFPFSMMNECTIAPVKTLSESAAPELPVFLVQANIIDGGLLVTFNGQHGSMEMAGLGEVIRLLAKACRNEAFTSSELSVGNMDRKNLICLPETDNSRKEKETEAPVSASEKVMQPVASQIENPSISWAYFLFTGAFLRALKSEAMSTVPEGNFISTNDVLSVFVWQSIARARFRRLGLGLSSGFEMILTLSRNVDVHRYLNTAPGYAGLLTYSTSHSM